jgi:hypothetical protein
MSESELGFSVAATRQNAGSVVVSLPAWADPLAGGAKVPASTARASVIVVSGSFSAARASHDVPAAARLFATAARISAHTPPVRILVIAAPLSLLALAW